MSGVPIFRSGSKRLTGRLPLTVTLVIAMLTVCAPHAIGAAECPLARQPRIPKAADAIVNLDTLKGRAVQRYLLKVIENMDLRPPRAAA